MLVTSIVSLYFLIQLKEGFFSEYESKTVSETKVPKN